MKKIIIIVVLLLTIAGISFALSNYDVEKIIGARIQPGTYKINVTREADNIYKVNYITDDVYIKTRYCYEYCYNKDVILEITSYSGYNIGKIHF